ncbi:SEC-C metal-binding domain-containing protein [Bacillus sp. SG-1]|uniref:SEC-C metal-binding domain-containing protein n=1 Tax=Bacillus sp. SG-1 TaxID=161544 RepID=UPI0002E17EDD|nr:SEC-C metal-binding domain-containing protein [Bacillus sp. SG-1]
MNFLERIEAALLSDDPYIQHYAVSILQDSHLATPSTLFIALEAYDRKLPTIFPSTILPHIDFLPVDEDGVLELISRLENDKRNKGWYLNLLKNAETSVLLKYGDQLSAYLDAEFLKELRSLPELDEEGLFMKLASVANDLDNGMPSHTLFQLGKRIVKEMIDRGIIEDWEVENALSEISEYSFTTFIGMFQIYMAGELHTESVIPELIKLLNRDDSDEALEEISSALIKIGTDEVVLEAEKIALIEDSFIYTLDVLAKIKSTEAEKALMRLWNKTEDITIKTIIADALCQHLSVEAIPLLEKQMEEGYDSLMADLEESFYANLVLNGIAHPALYEMRKNLTEREKRIRDAFSPTVKEDKVGRNDPCPCGSGKKYKKCCL